MPHRFFLNFLHFLQMFYLLIQKILFIFKRCFSFFWFKRFFDFFVNFFYLFFYAVLFFYLINVTRVKIFFSYFVFFLWIFQIWPLFGHFALILNIQCRFWNLCFYPRFIFSLESAIFVYRLIFKNFLTFTLTQKQRFLAQIVTGKFNSSSISARSVTKQRGLRIIPTQQNLLPRFGGCS